MADNYAELLPLSLLRRTIGGIIDIIIIIALFLISGFVLFSARFGYMLGLLSIHPSNYKYVEIGSLIRKGYDETAAIRMVDDLYSTEYLQSLFGQDIKMAILFIVINLVFYFTCEMDYGCTPGKKCMGGIVINNKHQSIDKSLKDCLIRSSFIGLFLLIFVLLHFAVNINYLTTSILFFIIMYIPILFTHKSVIDIVSGTINVKKRDLDHKD